jgi:ATP-dependent RNA helicase RhlE
LRAVLAEGYTDPTPIQEQAIPSVLLGRDLLGCAQTGTGKTAAFALPMLHHLLARPGRGLRALVLAPTRELAAQIDDSFRAYGRFTEMRSTAIFGGVNQHRQVQALRKRVDVLIATPGRLLDLMQQRIIRLGTIEMFVLDEADRMLDMGFIHDVRRVIAALPHRRQSLLFSATFAPEVEALARTLLTNPVKVAVTPQATPIEAITQSVYAVQKSNKPALLAHLLQDNTITRALVFTRTKHGADRVVKQLARARLPAEAIHGNKSQNARVRALANFKSGDTWILVATDIAARGIDIDGVSHVINYDLPNEPPSYVHRIGRTARAGATGVAYSFCDPEEKPYLRDIERLIQKPIPVVASHPFAGASPVTQAVPVPPRPRQQPPRRQTEETAARPSRRATRLNYTPSLEEVTVG